VGDIPAAGIPAVVDTAVRVVKAVRVVAGTVVRAEMRGRVAQAAVREDHAAAKGNTSARRKFASSASKKWT
jgi:hypothetical protein